MSSPKVKIENPILFVFMFFLFWLSVGLIGYGVFKNKSLSEQNIINKVSEKDINDKENEKSLSSFFENNQHSSFESGTDDYYLQTDPFKDTCSSGGGGGETPFVISGTVCYR